MAIAHDTDTRFPAGSAGDITTGDRTFTHTPVGTPAGAAVLVQTNSTTLPVTGVLYGGTAMTLSASSTNTTEAGGAWVYTLITSVPSGAQTVTLQGCTATAKFADCVTVTAATANTTLNTTGVVNTTTSTNPTLTLTTTATTMSYAATNSGQPTISSLTIGTGCTGMATNDYGANIGVNARRTSADASGSVVISWTASSDSWCMAGVSFAETAATSISNKCYNYDNAAITRANYW